MSTQSKREVAEGLLSIGSLFVHLDPRIVGVAVPPSFRTQPQLVLQVGLNMAVAIPDLTIDDHGIRATLSFNRTPHRCILPWEAVFALVGDDGRGSVFPESMPIEIRREVDREASASALALADELIHDSEASGEFGSDEIDAIEESGLSSPPAAEANVIPLWPRSVKGTGKPAPKGSLSAKPLLRSASETEPPDKPRPRPPHPHLRRVK